MSDRVWVSGICGVQPVAAVRRAEEPRTSGTSLVRTRAGSTRWSIATPATSPSAAISSRAERETPELTLNVPGSPRAARSRYARTMSRTSV